MSITARASGLAALATVSIFALAPALMVPAASAQEGAGPLEEAEIVVTARRTEERLQDVPVAITAFSGEELEARQAENIGALQGAVPNLNIVQGRGSNSSANVFIRGIGQPDALSTFDPGVGIYVDDVFLSRIRGALLDVVDITSVEVLRGPQGTLYGKNTIGGAIRITTARPVLEGWRADIAGTVGDFNLQQVRASGSIALVEGELGVHASIFGARRDGFVTDPVTPGREYNNRETIAGRLSVLWAPNDVFSLRVNADYTHETPNMTVGRAEAPLFRTNLALPVGNPGRITILAVPETGDFDFRTATTPRLPNENDLIHKGTSATMDLDFTENLRLRSITAWRDLRHDDFIDIDATQFELGDVFVGVDQEQFSQELQLNWTSDRLRLVGGLFAMTEDLASRQTAFANDLLAFGVPIGLRRDITDRQALESWAAYADGTWALTERLNLSLGLRGTFERKEYRRFTTTTLGPATTFAFDVAESWADLSPQVTLDYDFTDTIMGYARYAQGFKSGGFNGRANSPANNIVFRPETVDSFEAGVKSTLADGRVIFNAAAFYNDYRDFQARRTLGADPISADLGVENAAELRIFGAEFELRARPIDPLTLNASLGVLNSEYGEFRAGDGTDLTSRTPAFSPDVTGRIGAAWDIDLANAGVVTLAGDVSYRSEINLSVEDVPELRDEAATLVNASIAWALPDQGVRIIAGVQNITDEVYKTDAQEFASVGGIRTAYYGAPRTWQITVGKSF